MRGYTPRGTKTGASFFLSFLSPPFLKLEHQRRASRPRALGRPPVGVRLRRRLRSRPPCPPCLSRTRPKRTPRARPRARGTRARRRRRVAGSGSATQRAVTRSDSPPDSFSFFSAFSSHRRANAAAPAANADASTVPSNEDERTSEVGRITAFRYVERYRSRHSVTSRVSESCARAPGAAACPRWPPPRRRRARAQKRAELRDAQPSQRGGTRRLIRGLIPR